MRSTLSHSDAVLYFSFSASAPSTIETELSSAFSSFCGAASSHVLSSFLLGSSGEILVLPNTASTRTSQILPMQRLSRHWYTTHSFLSRFLGAWFRMRAWKEISKRTFRLPCSENIYQHSAKGCFWTVSDTICTYSSALTRTGAVTNLLFNFRITLISNLVTVIMVFDTSVPIPMRSMCATPNIVLTNIMACRVYRRTRAGLFRESEISTTAVSAKHRKPGPVAVYTSSTKATDPPFRVDIELPNRAHSQPSNISSHPSDGSKTYEGSMSSDAVPQSKKNDFTRSFVDLEKGA